MEVDHGGFDAGMSEKVLDGADVDSALEKMGGEGMAHAVRCGRLRDGCLSHSILELKLKEPVIIEKCLRGCQIHEVSLRVLLKCDTILMAIPDATS